MEREKEYLRNQQPNFPKPEIVGPRSWGVEKLLCLVPGKYMVKELFIKAGSKGGLQFHRKKDECGVLLKGEMIIRHENKSGDLVERIVKAGDVFHFPPGVLHQEEAITDCLIIEASSTHFNDRVRMEYAFGINDISGLPSTSLEEIEER